MPRGPRQASRTDTYHILCRGNNGQFLFSDPDDHRFYLQLLREGKLRQPFDLYHYCLMTNHIHLLAHCRDITRLSRLMHWVNTTFAKRYCLKNHFAGHVFQARFKALPIEDDAYLLECGRYIERNPCRAGMVNDPSKYLWSSFRFYAEGRADPLLTSNPRYLGLARLEEGRRKTYADYVKQSRPYDMVYEREIAWRWAGRGMRTRTGNRTPL
jgi:putative transposase